MLLSERFYGRIHLYDWLTVDVELGFLDAKLTSTTASS